MRPHKGMYPSTILILFFCHSEAVPITFTGHACSASKIEWGWNVGARIRLPLSAPPASSSIHRRDDVLLSNDSISRSMRVFDTISRVRGGSATKEEEDSVDELFSSDAEDEGDEEDGAVSAARALPELTSLVEVAVRKLIALLGAILRQLWSLVKFGLSMLTDQDPAFEVAAAGGEKARAENFGTYLDQKFLRKKKGGQAQEGSDGDRGAGADTIHGGSLADLLTAAREEAQLVLAFVPSSSSGSSDISAAKALRSEELRKYVTKAPAAAYRLWGAVAGSREADRALRRGPLKKQVTVRKSSPMLVVIYPAQVIDSTSLPRAVPKLLAQHHCNPPPSPVALIAWLRALRKRHGKYVALMRRSLKERDIRRGRIEGYAASVRGDRDREARELRAAEKAVAAEQMEKERVEAILARRQEMAAALPSEPETGAEGCFAVALRTGDSGSRGPRRRFNKAEATLGDVFNWADVAIMTERERLVFTAAGGHRYAYGCKECDMPLTDVPGITTMCGLRVSIVDPQDNVVVEDEDRNDNEQ